MEREIESIEWQEYLLLPLEGLDARRPMLCVVFRYSVRSVRKFSDVVCDSFRVRQRGRCRRVSSGNQLRPPIVSIIDKITKLHNNEQHRFVINHHNNIATWCARSSSRRFFYRFQQLFQQVGTIYFIAHRQGPQAIYLHRYLFHREIFSKYFEDYLPHNESLLSFRCSGGGGYCLYLLRVGGYC